MADDDKTKTDDSALKAIQAELDATKAELGATKAKLGATKAELEAERGKSAGILADKKKEQQRVADVEKRLEEIESKDLGELEKVQRDLERANSMIDKLKEENTQVKTEFETTQKQNSINEIGKKFKWLDTVPEGARQTILEKELGDIDLGNEVLVADKIKTITESYSGLLQANVPDGTGAKPGKETADSVKLTRQEALNKPLSEIADDPLKFVQEASGAVD